MDNYNYKNLFDSVDIRVDDSFDRAIMSAIKTINPIRNIKLLSMWNKYVYSAAVACLIILLLSTYLTSGSLDLNSLLGFGQYSELELQQYLNELSYEN